MSSVASSSKASTRAIRVRPALPRGVVPLRGRMRVLSRTTPEVFRGHAANPGDRLPADAAMLPELEGTGPPPWPDRVSRFWWPVPLPWCPAWSRRSSALVRCLRCSSGPGGIPGPLCGPGCSKSYTGKFSHTREVARSCASIPETFLPRGGVVPLRGRLRVCLHIAAHACPRVPART